MITPVAVLLAAVFICAAIHQLGQKRSAESEQILKKLDEVLEKLSD